MEEIASELNLRSKSYEIGSLQDIRKTLKGLSRLATSDIFSGQSIQKDYAFHLGGRSELQFNVGWENVGGKQFLRHGVAFSLEPSRTLPSIDTLIPKIARFNEFIRTYPDALSDFDMWHFTHDERSSNYPVRSIPPELVRPHTFLFVGRLGSAEQPDYDLILSDLDRLLPLYTFVEGTHEALTPLVLVQNDATTAGKYDHWEDLTGVRYHFPNVYKNRILKGRPFIYYRGIQLRGKGRRPSPEYFGYGRIGSISRDTDIPIDAPKKDWKYYAEIVDYVPFPTAVPWKMKNGRLYEELKPNLRQIGARDISSEQYRSILDAAGVRDTKDAIGEPVLPPMPDLSLVIPNFLDGSATLLLKPKGSTSGIGNEGGNGNSRRSGNAHAIGKRAEEIVFRTLERTLSTSEAQTLKWLSRDGETPGWDIQFTDTAGELRRIEVKGTTANSFANIEITAQEWASAKTHRKGYWLYLVAQCMGITPMIQSLCDPYALYVSQCLTATPVLWRLQLVG